jgi:hypothetical protein
MLIEVTKGAQKVWAGDAQCVSADDSGAITVHTDNGSVLIGPATARAIVRALDEPVLEQEPEVKGDAA